MTENPIATAPDAPDNIRDTNVLGNMIFRCRPAYEVWLGMSIFQKFCNWPERATYNCILYTYLTAGRLPARHALHPAGRRFSFQLVQLFQLTAYSSLLAGLYTEYCIQGEGYKKRLREVLGVVTHL